MCKLVYCHGFETDRDMHDIIDMIPIMGMIIRIVQVEHEIEYIPQIDK